MILTKNFPHYAHARSSSTGLKRDAEDNLRRLFNIVGSTAMIMKQ